MADDQRYSCQECSRDDLSLTKNGRVRSHAENGKRATADNPACGGGSNFPIQDTEHHTHSFEYADDDNGHSGSFCTVDGCGMAEPDNLGDQRQAPERSDVATAGDGSWTDDSDPQAAMADAPTMDAPIPPEAQPTEYKPTASEYREASAIVRSPDGASEADIHWAQDVLDQATSAGVRADDPEGDCTCPGKKSPDMAHNAACPRYVPRTVTRTGGPNPHRAPLSTGSAPVPKTARPAPKQSAEEFLGGTPVPQPPASAAPAPSADDAANAFLGAGPAGPAQDANDFLATEQEESEDDGPHWFEARYDGACGSCGERFLEGDLIARDPDGSGDWIGQECCGHTLEEDSAEDVPRVDRTDPMVRLKAKLVIRNGRYEAPDPEAKPGTVPKKQKFTRVTTFVKLASDSFALSQWSQRMAILGLVHRPELGRKVRTLLENATVPPHELAKLERDRLNDLVDQAKDAAGHKIRAAKGTILHTHTEKLDRGEQQPGEIVEEFRKDAVAYLSAVERFGLKTHVHLVERSTVVVEMGVIGTFDRDYEITRRITATLPGKGKTPGRLVTLEPGEFVVGDVKTGADLQYGQEEIATQISLYAKGQNRHGIATPVVREDGKGYDWTWRKPGESAMDGTDWVVPKVREDVGIVVHIPYGEGTPTVYLVDLEEGWRNAQACLEVQTRQRVKKVFTALPLAAVEGAPARDTSMPTAANLAGHKSITGTVNGVSSADAAKGAENLAATAKASAAPAQPMTPGAVVTTWRERFAAVETRAELKALSVQAAEAGMPIDVLEAFMWHAMDRIPDDAPPAELAKTPAAPPTTVVSWADRFAAVTNLDALKDLARQAQAAGMPKGRLLVLFSDRQNELDEEDSQRAPVRPAPLPWADRFAAVESMQELAALCQAAVKAGMPRDRVKAYWNQVEARLEPPF
jgi:hypothetical protein